MEPPFPAYRGDEPYTFVCFAHSDSEMVYADILWLHDRGVHIWYDEGIALGTIWRAEIARALEGSSRVLYFVSRASLASEHCNREINYALDQALEVLPIYLEDVALTPDLRIGLSRIQALHRHNMQPAAYRGALADALGGSGEGTRADEPDDVDRARYRSPNVGVGSLRDLSRDQSLALLAEAVVDDIGAVLATAHGLHVVADATSADYQVDGSIRPMTEGARLSLQLTEASSGMRFWTQHYEVAAAEVAELRFEHTEHAARTIEARVRQRAWTPLVKSASEAARQHFSAAELEWAKIVLGAGDWGVTKQHLELAIQMDPSFAPAYQFLATLYVNRFEYSISAAEAAPRARDALEKAYALEPSNWLALTNMGRYAYDFQLDYESADRFFRDAMARGGIMGVVFLQIARTKLAQGLAGPGIAALQSALASDKLADAPPILLTMGLALLTEGEYARAIDTFDAAIRSSAPGGWRVARLNLLRCYASCLLGDTTTALRALGFARTFDGFKDLPMAAASLALVNRTDEAESILSANEARWARGEFVFAIPMFYGYFHLGQRDEALLWMSRAIDDRETMLFHDLRTGKHLDDLRSDARFQANMRRLEEIEVRAKGTCYDDLTEHPT